MLLGADFHSQFTKRSNFSPPRPTYRCSFKEPFEGLGHSAVFTNDSPAPESTVNAPNRPHFPSAPVTLSSIDNVTVQLRFVRLAFSIAGDVVMAGFQQAHVDRIVPNLRHTWQNREIHQSTTCLLEISRGCLLFEVGDAGDFFLLIGLL